MATFVVLLASSLLALAPVPVAAAPGASCSLPDIPFSGSLSIGTGFTARVITNKVRKPRQMIFDTEGNLLVVEAGKGIVALKLEDKGGDCVAEASRTQVVTDSSLNHAIELTPDGKTLFSSSSDKVFSWDYDAKTQKVGSPKTWVTGMWNTDHVSRTILIPKKNPTKMLISRGSNANIDYQARQQSSGHCQIRMFDISGSPQSVNYATGGTMVAWGLRNSIGLAEHPVDGGIWSNENGSDNMSRDGKDIHENSPGEEINFHGYLNGTSHSNYQKNFGYPDCAAAWHVSEMPRNANLKVGKQFYLSSPSGVMNDTTCETQFTPPRLTLPSHWAPIDFKFNSKGTVAYMTSRGSWNRWQPDGYKLFAISWDPQTGQPIHPPNSETAVISVLQNRENRFCPLMCIRPTGIAFGPGGRLYVASERSGEIFVIGRADGSSVDSTTLETQAPGNVKAIEGEEPVFGDQSDAENVQEVEADWPKKRSPWALLWNLFGSAPGRLV